MLEKWAMFMSHCAGPMFGGNLSRRKWTLEQWQSLPLIEKEGCAPYQYAAERAWHVANAHEAAEDSLTLSDHDEED